MKAPIHSTKHYVQISLSTVTTGATLATDLVLGVNVSDKNTTLEVEEGALVKAVYLEIWAIGSSSNQFFTAILAKFPSGQNAASVAEMAALGDWENKKNILYTTQGLASNDGIAAPIPIIRQWFKIPKGKQRFGLLDRLRFQIASRGSADIIICGFATYKEYT